MGTTRVTRLYALSPQSAERITAALIRGGHWFVCEASANGVVGVLVRREIFPGFENALGSLGLQVCWSRRHETGEWDVDASEFDVLVDPCPWRLRAELSADMNALRRTPRLAYLADEEENRRAVLGRAKR